MKFPLHMKCVCCPLSNSYELGRLTSGRAAELAGMPRVEFLMTLQRYKIFPLESELRELEMQHA